MARWIAYWNDKYPVEAIANMRSKGSPLADLTRRGVPSRMTATARRAALLASAKRQVAAQGFFPIPYDMIARDAGVSKGLVYAYFATQEDLANALLTEVLTDFDANSFSDLSQAADPERAITEGLGLYFNLAASHGPMLRIIVTDRYLRGGLDPKAIRILRSALRQLGRTVQQFADLDSNASAAALRLFLIMADEAGRIAYLGQTSMELAKTLCAELIASGVRQLRAPIKQD